MLKKTISIKYLVKTTIVRITYYYKKQWFSALLWINAPKDFFYQRSLLSCFAYWPPQAEFDLRDTQKRLLKSQNDRNKELAWSRLRDTYQKRLIEWDDNLEEKSKVVGWIDSYEYMVTAFWYQDGYWDVLDRRQYSYGLPVGYEESPAIAFKPYRLFYTPREIGFNYSSFMRKDLIDYAKNRFLDDVYDEFWHQFEGSRSKMNIFKHSWKDVKRSAYNLWKITRTSMFYENSWKLHHSNTYVHKIIEKEKNKYYHYALERMKKKLKARWVLLNVIRSPKAHGAVMQPLPAYYLENHLRFLPEEFYYTRNPEYLQGLDNPVNVGWGGTIWEPTERYHDRSLEDGIRLPYREQEWALSNRKEQLKETRNIAYGFEETAWDFSYNRRDKALIHQDIRQSVMHYGFWTQWAEFQKGNPATSLKYLEGEIWPEKGSKFNWDALNFWKWNNTFVHAVESAWVSHSWYWSEVGLVFWLVGGLFIFEVCRHEITWRVWEKFPKFAEWNYNRRKVGKNMWQTNFFICMAAPILILILGDFTTDWSFAHSWNAYDVERPFVDQLDRLTEYDDWDFWDETEWTAWKDSFLPSYAEENYVLEDMEEKRPEQPTNAPVRHELYHGYLDIRNNLKNYTNDRRIESGTDWYHGQSPHWIARRDIRGGYYAFNEVKAYWHHDRYWKMNQMLIANEPNALRYNLKVREWNSITELYWNPWSSDEFGYDIPFGWYLDYDISWHYKLSEAFNSLYGNALGQTIVWFPGISLDRVSRYIWRPTNLWRWNYSQYNRELFDNIYKFYDFWWYGWYFNTCFLSDVKLRKKTIKKYTYVPWREYILAGFGDNLLLWRDKKLAIPLPGTFDEDGGENSNVLYGLTYGDYTYAHLRRKVGNSYLALNK
jgi:hypothetical protein